MSWPECLQKIGSGTFGQVYSVFFEGQLRALKVIRYKEARNPALFECFVMSTFSYRFLQKATQILIDAEKIGIVSDLAVANCSKHRKTCVINNAVLRSWILRLLLAVDYLHQHHLIHGDIKASNILYFSENDIRLSDFGLTRPYLFRRRFARPCSPTHRPLEVWRDQDWDYTVDIWALGCTIFELVFGYSLFPLQTGSDSATIAEKSIACLKNWFRRGSTNSARRTHTGSNLRRSRGDFNSAVKPENFTSNTFTGLIMDCLQKRGRPSARSLLAKYYPDTFVSLANTSPVKISSPYEVPEFVEPELAQLFQQLRGQLDLEFSSQRETLLRGLYRLVRQLAGLKVSIEYFSEEIEVCRRLGFALTIDLN
jgi:serine/threonine protein kinase